jgi:urease accessory protein
MIAPADIAGPTGSSAAPPRAQGQARLGLHQGAGRTRIATLRLAGSLKLLFPRGGDDPLEAVMLNTAGGLTGGDRMDIAIEAGPGTATVVTSQAAERVYRAAGGQVARVGVRITAAAGACVDWLPQETILFDGGALERRMRVDLAGTAGFLAVETLVFGRLAMGERVRRLFLSDRWEIRREGRLVAADAIRIAGDAAALLARAGAAGGGAAVATLLYAGPGAEGLLAGLRAALGAAGGASLVREGVILARAVAADQFLLRRAMIPAIETMTGRPVPRVWRL